MDAIGGFLISFLAGLVAGALILIAKRSKSGPIAQGVVASLLATAIVSLSGFAVTVVIARPSIELTVDQDSVPVGEKVRVSWQSRGADSVWLEGITPERELVENPGSRTVRINERKTFVVRASISWLSVLPDFLTTAVESKTVVIQTSPSVRFWAEPPEVLIGEYASLRWETDGAARVLLKGVESGPLPVEPVGSRQAKMIQTKTFQIVASNRAGQKSQEVTVTVRTPEVSVRIWAEPPDVEVGEATTLFWQAQNADKITIGGIGEVEAAGSRQIRVDEPKTFEVVASNRVATKRATITVGAHHARLVFLGAKHIAEHIDQAVRADLENFFRAKGYEVLTLKNASFSLDEYLNTSAPFGPRADYAVYTDVQSSGWKSSGAAAPFVRVNRYTIEVSISIFVVRTIDRAQLGSATGKGNASITRVQTAYGQFSQSVETRSKEMEAAQKAIKDALSRLSLSTRLATR
jgi:hypothetical protein